MHFDVLPTMRELQERRRSLSRLLHSDRNDTNDLFLMNVNEAFNILHAHIQE